MRMLKSVPPCKKPMASSCLLTSLALAKGRTPFLASSTLRRVKAMGEARERERGISSRCALVGWIDNVICDELLAEHSRFLARRFRGEAAKERHQGGSVDVRFIGAAGEHAFHH